VSGFGWHLLQRKTFRMRTCQHHVVFIVLLVRGADRFVARSLMCNMVCVCGDRLIPGCCSHRRFLLHFVREGVGDGVSNGVTPGVLAAVTTGVGLAGVPGVGVSDGVAVGSGVRLLSTVLVVAVGEGRAVGLLVGMGVGLPPLVPVVEVGCGVAVGLLMGFAALPS
jgi:hypothetical protein